MVTYLEKKVSNDLKLIIKVSRHLQAVQAIQAVYGQIMKKSGQIMLYD